MRIGELSERTGVSRRLLRYYEDQGLLESVRAASGQRHYNDDHIRRVELIRTFLAAGLSTRTIAEMVPCMAEPSIKKAQRAQMTMERERKRLSSAIKSLILARETLDDLIDFNRTYLTEHSESAVARRRVDGGNCTRRLPRDPDVHLSTRGPLPRPGGRGHALKLGHTAP